MVQPNLTLRNIKFILNVFHHIFQQIHVFSIIQVSLGTTHFFPLSISRWFEDSITLIPQLKEATPFSRYDYEYWHPMSEVRRVKHLIRRHIAELNLHAWTSLILIRALHMNNIHSRLNWNMVLNKSTKPVHQGYTLSYFGSSREALYLRHIWLRSLWTI